MAVVKVDASNEKNFQQRRIMPKGRFLFEVANDLKVEKAKTSSNNVVNVVLKCVDDISDGKHRAATVFDTIALTTKAEWKLVHLALAAGAQTKDEIKTTGVDLSLIKGRVMEVNIDVQPPQEAADGTKYSEKNIVKQYMFEPESK